MRRAEFVIRALRRGRWPCSVKQKEQLPCCSITVMLYIISVLEVDTVTTYLYQGRRRAWNVKMKIGRFGFRWKMLYICIGKPRTSCKYRASSVSFYSDLLKNRPGDGATTCRIIFSKCFVVFSKCRLVFRKCFVVSRKQPADCFRRLKTLKLKGLDVPFFRFVMLHNLGTEICSREGFSCRRDKEYYAALGPCPVGVIP